MSTEQSEENREHVQQTPPPTTVVNPPPATTPPAPVVQQPAAPVYATTPPAEQRRESVVTRRSTNVGAIVAMVIGVLVLVFGIYLVFRVIPYAPYPWSLIAVLVVGLILIAVGASLVRSRGF